MPPGVAAAPAPSVGTGVGSIADRPAARQCSAATACASPSVTDVNAFSQSPGSCSAAPGSGGIGLHRVRYPGRMLVRDTTDRNGVTLAVPADVCQASRANQRTVTYRLPLLSGNWQDHPCSGLQQLEWLLRSFPRYWDYA
jgi:hypothetical protein